MEVLEVKALVPVSHMRTGEVFRYEGKYYMTTNAYSGQYTYPEKRVHVDLETGFWRSFKYERVEPVKEIRLVVGTEAEDDCDDDCDDD